MSKLFLDFEKPIEDIYVQIEKVQKLGETQRVDVSEQVALLEAQIETTTQKIYADLNGWQRVQLSRHPERPYTLFYINELCKGDFLELYGDRCHGDDKAMVGGFGNLDGQTVMFIGQQKGTTAKTRQYRNFGMPNPEGYRKALRLMKLAEKFNKPIVTFIDTPGAFPGIEAEERGQAEAIARNLFEMLRLKVPIICVIIGEGASGGALGIGIGDRLLMMENTWFSVISPESCSSILWRSWDFKETAAEQLQLTAEHMKKYGIVDAIIPEPLGGANRNPTLAAEIVKKYLLEHLQQVQKEKPQARLQKRIEHYASIGHFKTSS
ncbi:MAG: acetyl-CoA carboxylase carboxyltransferase subunit alpha [Chitinophagales bacterium]|nr:acetyl-CoA carboxylase carboxyltransferase subunit alpha [Bacteroidota bacterium]MCB9042256.1 acetyl-CoA carboxylase carboxyltransferase subunit alpha [Chitinophagales bacterium]